MDIKGHTAMPAPAADAPGYAELYARWAPAGAGQDVEGFHVTVLENAAWQYRNGRTTAGMALGGPLISARIDAEGIHVRQIGELPMPEGAA